MRVDGAPIVLTIVATLSLAAAARPEDRRGNPPFVDRAQERGLAFRHFNGGGGERYIPEITGSGLALLDYDLDGDLDVYFLQGSALPGTPPPPVPPRNALFRNDGRGFFEKSLTRRGSPTRATGWAPRWATSTATATRPSTSRTSVRTSCS